MFFIVLISAFLIIFWLIRDYLHWDVTKNFGDNSVPITKNSFNLAMLAPGKLNIYREGFVF